MQPQFSRFPGRRMRAKTRNLRCCIFFNPKISVLEKKRNKSFFTFQFWVLLCANFIFLIVTWHYFYRRNEGVYYPPLTPPSITQLYDCLRKGIKSEQQSHG